MSTPAERHSHILRRLQEQGFVKVSDLAERLDVSEVTIRKDLRTLEERDLLYRTHGGASPSDPYVLDRPVDEKAEERADEKRRIGRAAAALVEPGESVVLASGTTVLEVARALRTRRQLTVVTSALNVALALREATDAEVLLLGGMLRPSSVSVVGPYAEDMLGEHAVARAFIGVDGIDLEHGISTTHALEAQLNRAMIRSAQRTVVVADSSKFGRRGFRRICGLEQVDILITDEDAPDSMVTAAEEMGVEVRVV